MRAGAAECTDAYACMHAHTCAHTHTHYTTILPPLISHYMIFCTLPYYSLFAYFVCRKHAQDGLLREVAKSLTDQEVLLINAQLRLIGESAVVSTGAPCTVAYRLVKRNTVFLFFQVQKNQEKEQLHCGVPGQCF